MLAAAVMTSTPMIWPEPSSPTRALRPANGLDVVAPVHVAHDVAAVSQAGRGAAVMPTSHGEPLVPSAPKTQVCAPANPGGSKHRFETPALSIGSGGIYLEDGSGQQPILETPAMSTDSAGCVHVG
jgi:hypothetical protein